jgi:hypothetical protein
MTEPADQINRIFPTIHLVYGAQYLTKPDQNTLVESLHTALEKTDENDIQIDWRYQDKQSCLGSLRFNQHTIQVAGLAAPLPQEIVDCTIHPSPWQPQIKAAMRMHQSHISLVYNGTDYDPVEKMIALYSAAHAFAGEDLLGILNEGAWTAHPPANYLSPEKIQSYRQDIPFTLWMGYVKFFVDSQRYWLVSKGHHIFDVPDLAYFVNPEDEAHQIISSFINIFYYIYEKDTFVRAGDTLEIPHSGQFLKFSEVPEGADFLMGPSGTLVIEKIDPEEISQKN